MTATAVASGGDDRGRSRVINPSQEVLRNRQRQRRAWAGHQAFKTRLVNMLDAGTLREMSRLYATLTANERAAAYRELLDRMGERRRQARR